MPGNIDEQVLSMRFDNKQFEKGIDESSKSIDEFKKKLDFSKSSSGLKTFSSSLSNINKKALSPLKSGAEKTTSALTKLKNALSFSKATKSLTELGAISFDGLQSGMRSLGEKLESLGSLGEMAMYRIRNAILDAAQSAIQFGKSLSIDQISAGLGKYETKISSIKTIANATQLSAEKVNSQLDRLNWFTDETSASFESMVQNIGKFTSVGRGLGESITAMQGIATWGYHSGAGVAEQTRAMYNLSQALGTGSVKLMDWKSIENAGMATKEFKEQAIAAAEAAGTLIRKNGKLFTKDGKESVTASNFNATLAKGWFTSDVLMDVLKEYGGFATKVRKYQEQHPGQFSLASEAMEQMDIDRMTDRLNALSPNLDDLAKKTGQEASKIKEQWQEVMDFSKGEAEDFSFEELEKRVNSFTKSLGISMDEVLRINKIVDVKERTKEIKKWAETLGVDVKIAEKLLKGLAETEETIGEKAFKSSQQTKTFTEAIEATKDAVSTQWMNSFQIIFGGLDDSIKLWSDVTEMLWGLFASGGEARNNALTQWANAFHGRDDLFGEDGFLHSIYDSIISVKEALGTSFKDVFFPSLNKALNISSKDEKKLQHGLVTYDQLLFYQQGNTMGQELKYVTTDIKEFGQSIKDFFTNEENVANMGRVFGGVFSVLKSGLKILSAITGGISDFTKQSGAAGKMLSVFADIGDKVGSFVNELQYSGTWHEFRSQITETLMGFDGLLDDLNLDFITSSLKAIFGIFKNGWKFVRAGLKGISNFLKNSGAINKVLGLFNNFATRVSNFMDRIEKSGVFDDISNTITDTLTEVSTLLDDIDLEFVDHILDAIFATVRGIASFISPIVNGVTKGLKKSKALKTAARLATQISDSVKRFFDNIRNNGDLKKFEDGITELVAQFGDLFKDLDLSKLDTFFTGAWAIITNAWEGIKTVFTSVMEFLDTFGIPQAVVNFFTTLGEWFTWLSDKLEEYHVWEDITTGLKEGIRKIKEVYDHFKEEITRFFEDSGIARKFHEWKEKLKEWFFPTTLDENGNLTGIAKVFSDIRQAFDNGIEKLKNAKVYDWLMEKWQWLKDSGIIEGLKEFWNTIKSLFGGGKDAEEAGNDAEKGEEAIEKQGSFFEKIKEVFGKIDLGSVTGALIGVGALALAFMVVLSITSLIKRVTSVISSITTFVQGLTNLSKTLSERFKKSSKFVQIGIMIAAIGGALWLVADSISKLGQLSTEELIRGGIGITVVAGIILGMIFVMKQIEKNGSVLKIKDMLGIILITLMLRKLADTLISLSQLTPTQLITGIAGMGAILLLIYGFMNMVQDMKRNVSLDMGFLFTIGDVMKKLAEVVIMLGALPVKHLTKGLLALGSMMAMLALFMEYTSKTINKDHYSLKNTAGFMKLIGTALSLVILAKVLKSLGEMPLAQIGKGIIAMGGIMLLLGAFMRLTTKEVEFDKFKTKNIAGFFKMIGVALAMMILAKVLKQLGEMPAENIAKGLVAMAGIMTMLGVFMKATSTTFNKDYYKINNSAGFFKIIGFALAMVILARILERLAKLQWNEIGRGLFAMAGIMLLLGVFIKAMTHTFESVGQRMLTKNDAGFIKLMGIALAIVLLAHAFKGLANLSWSGIVKGLISLTAIMALLMIFVKMASGQGLGAGIKSAVTFGVMIGLGVAVTLFALSIRSLASLPIDGILRGVIGLTGILLAIAVFMKVTSKLTTAGGLMKGLLVLIPIAMGMGLFVLALQAVANVNPKVIAAFGIGLAAVVGAMGYLVSVIALFGAIPITVLVKGALAVSAMMAVVIIAATALVSGLGALANIAPGFKKALESGVEVLGLVGSAFGNLIGYFIGGILTGIASAGPAFAAGIEALGNGLKAFSESVSGMGGASSKDREAAVNSLLSLVMIAHLLPKSGGLLQLLTGQSDMGKFAKDVAELGNGLKSFTNSIKGISKINKNDRNAALLSITALVGIAHILPRKGGLLQKIFGQGDLGEFAENVGKLGKGLKSFCSSIRGMSRFSGSEDMTAAMDISKDLAKFAKFVTDPGSFGDILRLGLGKMFGINTDFGEFVDYIEPFGKALGAYSKAVRGIGKTTADSEGAISVAEDILKFKNRVEDPGTVASILLNWFAGDAKGSFGQFILQIEPFGLALKAYATAISGFSKTVSEEDANAAINAAVSIKTFSDEFKSKNLGEALLQGIDNLFGNNSVYEFTTFIGQIGPFGEALSAYAQSIGGFSDAVSEGDAERAIATAEDLQKFAEGFGSKTLGEALLDAIDSLFGNGEIHEFTQFTKQIKPLGDGLKAYADGISKIAVITPEEQKSALVAAEGLKSFAESFGTASTVKITAAPPGMGLFSAIAFVLGGFFAGSTENSMTEFETFSEGMVSFGQGLTNYAKGIKDIDTLEPGQADTAMQTVEAVKKFAESLVPDNNEKTWFENLISFGSFLSANEGDADNAGGALSQFGTAMQSLGQGISEFAKAAGVVEIEKSDNAIKAVESIAALANSELLTSATNDTGGLWNTLDTFFNGNKINALISFSGKMKEFGSAVSEYATSLQDFPDPKEIKTDNAIKSVENFYNAIAPLVNNDKTIKTSGYNGAFIDFFETITNTDINQTRFQGMMSIVKDMGTFGSSIRTFSDAMNEYKKPSNQAWDDLTGTLREMSGFATELINSGLSADNTYSIYGLANDLALAIPEFVRVTKLINGTADESEEIKTDKLEIIQSDVLATFTSIIGTLRDLSIALKEIPAVTGEDYVLTAFGKGVSEVATGIIALGGSLSSIPEANTVDSEKIDMIMQVIEKFKMIVMNLGSFWEKPAYRLTDFGYDIREFINSYVGKINWGNVDISKMNDISSAVAMLAYSVARIHEAGVKREDMSTIGEIMTLLLGLNNQGTAEPSDQSEVAKQFIANFSTALSNEVTTRTTKGGDVYTAGYNLSIGFANGMLDSDAKNAVGLAAKAVIDVALAAMKIESDEESPSKATELIGRYMNQGLVNGLGEDHREIVKGATNAVGLALEAFSAAMDEDPDEQPTITPVVDLSNVEKGAETAGDLFNGRYKLGVNTSSDLAGRAANQGGEPTSSDVNVNVDTSSVAATIDTMNARLTELTTQMTNLKVVLNSGALVGQIAPQMNRELGRMANRNAIS